MTDELSFENEHLEHNWGCSFFEVKTKLASNNIFVCYVRISDLEKIANELSKSVMDDSWMMNLDLGARRAYRKTVADTAKNLVGIFKSELYKNSKVSGEFGEIMVSMGSSRALEIIFNHISLPISELWKPQIKGNEGFDFHTVCSNKVINFGEAKFSGSKNPYGGVSGEHSGASGQTDGFFNQEKHLRDRVHLVNLVDEEAINNLDDDTFGAILAFSINSKEPLDIISNAIEKIQTYQGLQKAKNIYLVGVSHDS